MEMGSLLGKIAKSLESEISVGHEWPSAEVSLLAEDRLEAHPDLSGHLAGLLERREVFRVDYQNVTGQISSYELHPLQILAYHGNW